ncbi:FecR family protein [Longitalea luteola]|uniref:FecR family protein n=1 Tax=Longitalea luteola TaxID=2812563 RepID=UPI001A96A0EF|nr:FecR family protein [Longitalea luteola]
MYLEHKIINEIIVNYFLDELTEEQQAILDEWLLVNENRLFFERITAQGFMEEQLARLDYYKNRLEMNRELIWNKIHEANNSGQKKNRIISIPKINWLAWRPWVYAAASIGLLLMGTYFWRNTDWKIPSATNNPVVTTTDIPPGSQKATLTLADGRKISLDSASQGAIAKQGNTVINNYNGQLKYDGPALNDGEMQYNTLSTNKGETYQLQLPDGSRVWLNAASSIRYPIAFSQHDRTVEVTGEVYFEAASIASGPDGKKIPLFVDISTAGNTVESQRRRVEVLGTHFNINAYSDEPAIKVTLLEGKIKVMAAQEQAHIYEGQQARISLAAQTQTNKKFIQILNDVDIAQAVAWKDGKFNFNHSDLKTVMRQIVRWYDLEVVYYPSVPEEKFFGEMHRNTTITGVLMVLEETSSVHFTLEGRRIIVKP